MNQGSHQKSEAKMEERQSSEEKEQKGLCGGEQFYVQEYYVLQKIVGTGSYGVVVSALDTRTNEMVAIKKIRDVFIDLVDTKRILREIKLLKFLNHTNVVKLVEIIKPCDVSFDDIYLVFEFMQTDLEKVISSRMTLTDAHIMFFMFQLLQGIYYLHSGDIIHRDLKPDNLLVSKKCELKICDLGLARKFEDMNLITDYVVTRWYRAPEIILSSQDYTKSIDIWSIGCIFAEILGRTPLFQGRHFMDQIERIIAVLGTPEDLDRLSYKMDAKTKEYMESVEKRKPQVWAELLPNANPLALDLLDKMIQYDPVNRWDALQCLQHPYFQKFHAQNSETELFIRCEKVFDWSFDQIQLNKNIMKMALIKEIGNGNVRENTIHQERKRLSIEEKEKMRDEQKDKQAACPSQEEQ